jgi:hypothetical protein
VPFVNFVVGVRGFVADSKSYSKFIKFHGGDSVNPVLKKLQFKGQSPVLLMGAPAEFQKTAKDFKVPLHTNPKGQYDFILGFVTSLAEGEKMAKLLKKAVREKTVIWVAYPKGTSKKYKSDYNRDTGNALMEKQGFTGVSLVALDEDWSAMRFKVL